MHTPRRVSCILVKTLTKDILSVNLLLGAWILVFLQVGDGVSQDFHLAKRYFDQAAQVDNKAKIPRDIALVLLEVCLCILYKH